MIFLRFYSFPLLGKEQQMGGGVLSGNIISCATQLWLGNSGVGALQSELDKLKGTKVI